MSCERKPFLVRCRPCAHVWPAAYLPMPVALFAKVAKRAFCPMCGARGKDVLIAGAAEAEAWHAAQAGGAAGPACTEVVP